VRLDKWLWTARLFKTRSAATEAVSGGRVRVNGAAAKPSREVHPGDELQISSGPSARTVIVRGAAERRVPPRETGDLWEETAASLSERERQRELRRLSPPVAGPGGRPTKRDRRRYDQTRRGGSSPEAG
jgi:ribosome-associated heat shock protein Hsp15